MDLDLKDRVYIVSDGASELGRATAECLVAEGARVVMAGDNEHALDTAVTNLGGSQDASVFAVGDDADAPERLVAAAQATWGRLDGALIGVGDSPGGPVLDVTDAEWITAFETVFLGAVRLSRCIAQALPYGGSLALALSSSVHEPIAGLGVANGFHPGLASIALQLADELGPHGIRVNGLIPGLFATQRTTKHDAAVGDSDPGGAVQIDTIPLRRCGSPEEFGRVAMFLLSPAASYISGAVVPVDGGTLRSL